jgi:hypothetical protein
VINRAPCLVDSGVGIEAVETSILQQTPIFEAALLHHTR